MNRVKIIMLCAVIAVIGSIGAWWFSQEPPLHPEVSINVVHAAPGVDEGCVICHKSAIPFTTCSGSDCHDAPSSTVGNNIYLKHHDLSDGCEVCHSSVDGDARYIEVPTSGHGFCSTCHSSMVHDSPP